MRSGEIKVDIRLLGCFGMPPCNDRGYLAVGECAIGINMPHRMRETHIFVSRICGNFFFG